jgi:hypothetical protein
MPCNQCKQRIENSCEQCVRLTPELSDAGGPGRSNYQQTWPARIRSSDFVGLLHQHLTGAPVFVMTARPRQPR